MAEKRVSVRLAAVGGRQVRAELEGVGEAGARGFGRLGREMEAANQRMDAFWRRARVAATAATAALAAGAGAMIRSGLQVIDNQAKLAQSLDTTVASVQVLERAGELAGVAMSGIEQATKDLTRRLSQAAAGTGPAADALERLGLSAADLLALPLDERVGRINQAITAFVPAAERAAVAGQLFGEEGSIAISRIDTATLRQATADVRDFGVVVSEQDADRIERTNDAISRLGLIWRGVSNQLAVAAAPALEAVANGLAEVAKRTGPLGQAIGVVFDQIGRLAATAAAFAGFMAGRWVASLVAGAVSVRGLATALVFLRGALVRTGIGALVVGAGELIYQFGRLASATGGIGNALGLLGRVAREVWSRMGTGLDALVAHTGAAGLELRAAIADALDQALRSVVRFGNAALNTFRGAFAALRAIWGRLPIAIGDLAFQAANALIAGVEAMLNGVGRRVNGFLRDLNAGLEALSLDRRIGLVGELSLGRIANPFAGAAAEAGASAREAFETAFAGEPIAAPDLGLGAHAEEARTTAAELRQVGEALTALATAPLASVAALREALQIAGESADAAAQATDRLDAALAAVGGGAGGDGAGAGTDRAGGSSSSGSAGRAAGAGKEAGDAIADAADRAATGWAAVRDALTRYAGEAMAVGRQLGNALVSAFRGAEDVFVGFVTKGKLDFRGLADSILADLTRIALRSAVLGPLANALGGALGDGAISGNLLAGVFHAGGTAGVDPSSTRLVPAGLFATAPRLHEGGWAGLRPDEVPAILQRGERVLSRGDLAAAERTGRGRTDDRPVQVVMNITTPDANSFRYAQGQLAADAARAMQRAKRNL